MPEYVQEIIEGETALAGMNRRILKMTRKKDQRTRRRDQRRAERISTVGKTESVRLTENTNEKGALCPR
jgi:hypothetical protein